LGKVIATTPRLTKRRDQISRTQKKIQTHQNREKKTPCKKKAQTSVKKKRTWTAKFTKSKSCSEKRNIFQLIITAQGLFGYKDAQIS